MSFKISYVPIEIISIVSYALLICAKIFSGITRRSVWFEDMFLLRSLDVITMAYAKAKKHCCCRLPRWQSQVFYAMDVLLIRYSFTNMQQQNFCRSKQAAIQRIIGIVSYNLFIYARIFSNIKRNIMFCFMTGTTSFPRVVGELKKCTKNFNNSSLRIS